MFTQDASNGASRLPTTLAQRALDDEPGADLLRHIAVSVSVGLIWQSRSLPGGIWRDGRVLQPAWNTPPLLTIRMRLDRGLSWRQRGLPQRIDRARDPDKRGAQSPTGGPSR